MKTITLISILCIAVISAFYGNGNHKFFLTPIGQDPKEVIKQLGEFYTDHPFIYHELQYNLYPDHQSMVPFSTDSGIFIKSGTSQYSKLSSIESLSTQEYSLGIDHDEKMMVLSNIIHIPPSGPITITDVFSQQGSGLSINDSSLHQGELIYKSEFGEVEEARLVYQKDTFEPVRLILKYRRRIQLTTENDTEPIAPRLEIVYTMTMLSERNTEKLSLNNYLLETGDTWRPTASYADFELINNIQPIPGQNQ